MRTLTRLSLLGLLLLSCEDPLGPSEREPPDCPTGQDRLNLHVDYADSLHLVVGTAARGWVEWHNWCEGPLPNAELTWAIRDGAVARDSTPAQGPSQGGLELTVRPVRPGHTYLVVEGRDLADSAAIFVPDTVAMESLVSIAAGGQTSCAVSDDGITYCWGSSTASQLGEPFADPAVGTCWGIPCSPVPVRRATTLHGIALSDGHACALDDTGKAWCWGDGYAGQLGTSNGFSHLPVEVQGGIAFSAVTLGTSHTCGLTPTGEAYCWGDPVDGKLGGDQRTGTVASPEPVAGDLSFVSLAARRTTTCGVTQDGILYCWGALGDAVAEPEGVERCFRGGSKNAPDTTVPCAFTPYRMPLDPEPITQVVFQRVSGQCALTTQGAVYCLDPARAVYAARPDTGPFTVIAGGDGHNCGLNAAGEAACWGFNGVGQLGRGTTGDSEHPLAVLGGHTFTALAAGSEHTCGLATDGTVWCWGGNDLGQAGTSILDRSWMPVRVHGQD
jgi:alpha-tubulin suppressor-like RCC1 family protein